MNSHQRRLAARYWPHQYDTGAIDWRHGIILIKWCETQFGPKGRDRWHYRYISHYPTEIVFWFHNSKDAAWFKLNSLA